MKKFVAVLGAAIVAALMSAVVSQQAFATTWYSQGSPLNVVEGGKVQGQAYGNYYNQAQTYAASQSNRRDNKPGGDGIFVKVYYYFQNSSGWYYPGSDRTNNTTSGSWQDSTYTYPLQGDSSVSRGNIHVCEDHNLAGDPCSAWVYPTFNY